MPDWGFSPSHHTHTHARTRERTVTRPVIFFQCVSRVFESDAGKNRLSPVCTYICVFVSLNKPREKNKTKQNSEDFIFLFSSTFHPLER